MNGRSSISSFLVSIGFYSLPLLARAPVTLLTIPIYTRYLTPTDYGLLEILDLTSFLIAALIGSQFGQALFYYYARALDANARERVVSTAFLGSFFPAAAGIAIAVFGSEALSTAVFGNAANANLVQLVIVSIALSFPAEVGFCCMRARDAAAHFGVLTTARLFASTALTITLLVFFSMGVKALLWSSVIVTGLTAVYMAGYCMRSLHLGIDRGLLLRLFRYAWPLGLSGIAALVLDLGDRYFLQHSVPLAQVGIYGLAYKIGTVISIFSLVFNRYWKPKMFSVVDAPDGERTYVRVCTYYTFAMTLGALALSVLGAPLVKLIVGKDFGEAAVYVPWIALMYVIRLVGDFFRNTFYLFHKTGHEAFVTWIGAGVCAAAYAILIPRLELWGAITATATAFIWMLVHSYIGAQKVHRFRFELNTMAIVFASAVALAAVNRMLPFSTVLSQLAAGAMCLLIYLWGASRSGIVHPGIWERLGAWLVSRRARVAGASS